MSKPIYLDYNATTPVDPRVLKAMLPYFEDKFGNAASTSHSYGWDAESGVNKARKQVAHLIGAHPKEILFTSGATESNNMVIQGVLLPFIQKNQKAHMITTQIEHKAVLDTAVAMESWGVEITYLEPQKDGRITTDQIIEAIRPDTRLVSLIYGNNEIGSLNPIKEIGHILCEKGIPFHTDAAQTVGKIPVSVDELKVDFLSGSAQKMYGPKGMGFLYRRIEDIKCELKPIMHGGAQEWGLRPGTLNVPGIVGLGEACEIFSEVLPDEEKKNRQFQALIYDRIQKMDAEIHVNGSVEHRIPTNVSLTFRCLNADILSMGLGKLALSSGSACSMGEPSYVLKAIGLTPDEARKTIRIGLGRFTTEEEVLTALDQFEKIIEKSRQFSAKMNP